MTTTYWKTECGLGPLQGEDDDEGRRKLLDVGSTGPILMGSPGGLLCPAEDVFRQR